MAFDQLKRARGDFFFTRAWEYPSEHLISQRENGYQIGIAADSAFFEFFHELNKGLVQFREENGEFALGELNRCYHFDD